jgi:predicted regulator of Ras-like GTPase activity (Roadblock/LC7/MglB family)
LFGQPGKSVWTPAEIVQKTSKLSGVSGALIALSDGLLVACQLPPALNGETIAAFLPQIFGRMSYYSRELKLGEPSSLTLVVDGVPIQIIKAGGLLLLVLGRAEEVLPGAQLAAVAAQLERQSKPG